MPRLQLARKGYLAMSVIFYAAAVLCIFTAEPPHTILCICCGVVLLFCGGVKLLGYTAGDLYCLAFQYDLAFGLLLLVLGVLALVYAQSLYPFLNVGLGLLVLLDSLLTIQMSRDARAFGLEVWNEILLLAIVTGTLGVLLTLAASLPPPADRIIAACALAAEGFKNQFLMKYAVRTPPDLSGRDCPHEPKATD